MTRNQISFWEYNEKVRSNRANEREQFRSHSAQEAENRRSNLAKEHETARNNVAVLNETTRANMAKEQQARNDLLETIRHNSVAEGQNLMTINENIRSHKANEAIGMANVGLGYSNVALGYSNLSEQATHNRAMESAQNSSNATRAAQVANQHAYNTGMLKVSQQKANYETSPLSRTTQITGSVAQLVRGIGSLLK